MLTKDVYDMQRKNRKTTLELGR